ncbi:MAG TPA: translation elongation factor Ts [Chloroflexota bacterium]|nr:translation elongation factor Ts [Chloroflexota bacterium]
MASTTELIKELREKTGAGIMECKRAIDDAIGDLSKAEQLLKERGLAKALKKLQNEANQGIVDSYIHAGGRIGALVEVNCQTDFVARNDEFRALVHDIAMQVAAMNPSRISDEEAIPDGAVGDVPLLDQPFIKDNNRTVRDLVHEGIAKLGENIVVRRFARFELGGG